MDFRRERRCRRAAVLGAGGGALRAFNFGDVCVVARRRIFQSGSSRQGISPGCTCGTSSSQSGKLFRFEAEKSCVEGRFNVVRRSELPALVHRTERQINDGGDRRTFQFGELAV